VAVTCEVKLREIKYPRYLQGNNSFEKLTGYLSSVYMAQYSGLSNTHVLIQPVNIKVKFLKLSEAVKGFVVAYISSEI